MRKKRWEFSVGVIALALVVVLAGCSVSPTEEEPAEGKVNVSELPLAVYTDVVSSDDGCVIKNVFSPGEHVVFRARVLEPTTGELMEDVSLKLEFANGLVFDEWDYEPHPPEAEEGEQEYYYTAAFNIPEDQEPGIWDYTLTAESADGRTGSFTPIRVPSSKFTVTAANGEKAVEEAEGTEEEANEEEAASTETDAVAVDVEAVNWDFDSDTYEVPLGAEVTLSLTNTQGYHTMGLEGYDLDIAPDQSVTFTADQAGEFTLFCSTQCGPGHDDMTATLVVE